METPGTSTVVGGHESPSNFDVYMGPSLEFIPMFVDGRGKYFGPIKEALAVEAPELRTPFGQILATSLGAPMMKVAFIGIPCFWLLNDILKSPLLIAPSGA